MERVAFLVEATGEHVVCLLNPETVVMTRTAGVRQREAAGGQVTGTGLADDPLVFTGGGRTELQLDLLFDVDLVPEATRPTDVRQLTRPVWRLAENSAGDEGQLRPPAVRFVWGKAWNVPGIVVEVAERFDRFGTDGAPKRSWLRMRFVRVGASADEPGGEMFEYLGRADAVDLDGAPVDVLVPLGDGATDPAGPVHLSAVELGVLAQRGLHDPLLWKLLMTYNGIDDPLGPVGPLAVPPPKDGAAWS